MKIEGRIQHQIEYHVTKIDERVRAKDYINAYMHECKKAELEHILLIIAPTLLFFEEEREEWLEALEEIFRAEGAYNKDPLQHAESVINSMTSIARKAIDKATK